MNSLHKRSLKYNMLLSLHSVSNVLKALGWHQPIGYSQLKWKS